MTDTSELEDRRREFALAFKQANAQLRVAQGVVKNKTLETALWGWRWGRAVNDIHGAIEPGHGGGNRPGQISADQMMAYCRELGVSTELDPQGKPRGRSTVYILRRAAARVATEEHLRELLVEHGTIWVLTDNLWGDESTNRTTSRDRARGSQRDRRGNGPATGYSRFVPPQSWSSYLIGQGMTRGEISAALCLVLDDIGPEESFKIWDRAGRPTRYDPANRSE